MQYTVKSGDTLSSIAAKFKMSVDELVSSNSLISPGKVLQVKDSAPVEPPVKIKFYEVGPGGVAAANKIIQSALNKEFGGVVVDGDYGPQTMAAYMKWQQKVGESAKPWDGLPGRVSLPPLAAKYNFTVDFAAPPTPPAGAEPAHNYTRTTYTGRTVNQRTKDMLIQAQRIYGGDFYLSQGSYNAGGVAASAGTHDGGGVIDIASSSKSLLIALKKAGFAAWIRTPAEGFSYHIHACAIGDREMAASAKNQVTSFFNGRNALVSNARDTNPDRYYPAWTKKYGAPI